MDEFLIYFTKMMICSLVMFGYYHLVLKDKTFHHYNRFYLLGIVLVSLFLPFFRISYFTLSVSPDIFLLLNTFSSHSQTPQPESYGHFYTSLFYAAFGLVSVLFLSRFLFSIFKIEKLKNKFNRQSISGIWFYNTDLESAPFSFFKNLFWKQSVLLESETGQQILKHEMVHIEQKHSIDKVVMEIITSVFWMNPVFWLIKKELHLIHEYLADQKAIKNRDTKAFAQMLLASHFSGKVMPATSPFLNSNLKKRLIMLKKTKTKYSYLRKILTLPVVFLLVFTYMVNAKNREITETNKAIESTVKQLKTDTIRPKPGLDPDDLAKKQWEKIKFYNEALKEDNKKVSELSKKINGKQQKLNALFKANKTETRQFEALQKEVESLSGQIDAIVNSDSYQNNLKAQEEHYDAVSKIYDSPEYRKKYEDIEKQAKEVEARVNSPEFQKRIKEAEKRAAEAEARVNSPEFKKHIKEAEERAKEAEKRAKKTENRIKTRVSKSENSGKYAPFTEEDIRKAREFSTKEYSKKIILKPEKISFKTVNNKGKVTSEVIDVKSRYALGNDDTKIFLNGEETDYEVLKKLEKLEGKIMTLEYVANQDTNESKLYITMKD